MSHIHDNLYKDTSEYHTIETSYTLNTTAAGWRINKEENRAFTGSDNGLAFFGNKPSLEPIFNFSKLDPWEQISIRCVSQ